MSNFREKSVLVNDNNDVILMSGQKAIITTNKGTKLEGEVRFIGDGSVSFVDDYLRVNFRQIEKIEIVEGN